MFPEVVKRKKGPQKAMQASGAWQESTMPLELPISTPTRKSSPALRMCSLPLQEPWNSMILTTGIWLESAQLQGPALQLLLQPLLLLSLHQGQLVEVNVLRPCSRCSSDHDAGVQIAD